MSTASQTEESPASFEASGPVMEAKDELVMEEKDEEGSSGASAVELLTPCRNVHDGGQSASNGGVSHHYLPQPNLANDARSQPLVQPSSLRNVAWPGSADSILFASGYVHMRVYTLVGDEMGW